MEAEVARFRELLPDTERFEKWRKNLNLFAAARHARWKRNSSYLRFLTENDQFESYFVRAFAERRWTLHGIHRKSNDHSRKLAIIGPMEFIPHQNRCYHATPKSNLASILDRGILPGHDSGQRTTKRDDSSHYIHVSTSHEDACHWATAPDLLARHSTEPFSIIEINISDLGQVLCHDPMSQETGWIANVEKLEPERFTHIDEISQAAP